MRQRLDKPPSNTKAVRAEVGVWGGEGEWGGISASNVIILINLCHSRQQLCVINAPDSRSPGAQRERGWWGGHTIPVGVGENFPAAS